MALSSEQLVEVLRAAGEPTRLRILALLAHEELSVLELGGILDQSQPRVSRHLKLLAEAGLVERFPDGAWVFYRLGGGGEGGGGRGGGVAGGRADRRGADEARSGRSGADPRRRAADRGARRTRRCRQRILRPQR